jgi:hypothetical protein
MQDDIVLCKIYRKAKSMKELEQRAAMEHVNQVLFEEASSSTVNADNSPSNSQQNVGMSSIQSSGWGVKNTADERVKEEIEVVSESLQSVHEYPLELLVPNYNFDLLHDTFCSQMCSAWLDQGSPYANLLNF